MADSIVTPLFRLSFPQLFEAKSFQGGEAKYSLTMLFGPDADLTELKEAAKAVAVEKWGADKIPGNLRSPFRSGSEKEHLDGYDETITFIRATSSGDNAPELVDRAKEEIVSRKDIYAGCYCRAVVTPFAYDTAGNKGVSFGVRVVQKWEDGASFGGGGAELLDDLPADTSGAAAPTAAAGDGFLD
jgi:hypothetical protein